MTRGDLAPQSVFEIVQALSCGDCTSVELVKRSIAAIEGKNPRLNAFLHLRIDAAKREAATSDERRRRRGVLSPLDGVPFGVKANIAVAGLPLHAGIGAYRDDIAGEDAGVVAVFKAMGAIPLGIVNMHEGALGATTDNLHFGRCGNPWGEGLTPGGSSGGSAAAVAAGLVPFALGTDTMGSVRIPSAYCGIAGWKPTQGLLPADGLLDLSPTLDHVGVHARTAADIGCLMKALGVPSAPEDPPAVAIGVWGSAVDVAPDVKAGFEAAVRVLERDGARPRIDLSCFDFGGLRRRGLLVSEVEGFCIHEARLRSHRAGFSADFAAMLDYGASRSAAQVEAAHAAIAESGARFAALVEQAGVLMLPTAPQGPFRFGDPVPANQADFTCLANFAGLPAVAVPATTDGAPPASVQFVASRARDDRALAAAIRFERARGPGFEAR